MTSKSRINTIKNSIKESHLLEEYLQELNKKYIEQQKRIADLDAQLNASFRKYKIFDSKFFQTLYGKYAVDRISKIEKIKGEYYKTALELKDYERINEVLASQKVLLITKLEENDTLIQNLLELMSYNELIQNVNAFQCDAFTEDQIVYYSQEVNHALQYVEEITLHSQECEAMLEDLQLFKVYIEDEILRQDSGEAALIRTSILYKIGDLPSRMRAIDAKLKRLMHQIQPKLKQWQGRHKHIGDTSEYFRLLRNNAQDGKGLIESLIVEGEQRQPDAMNTYFQLGEVSWIVSKVMGELLYLKHVILLEIEMAQKDVINFKNLQVELIKEQL